MLTACSQNIVGTASQICEGWQVITIDKADKLTAQTKKEIVGNNVASEQWCGPRPVAKAKPAAGPPGKPVS
jgi:hypothetical protein